MHQTNEIAMLSMLFPASDVAGIAAAIRSANPTWTPTQIRNAIVRKAADLPFG
jgi:subtilisin family serine protease